jgi:sulfonate transport system substrate-binding protein
MCPGSQKEENHDDITAPPTQKETAMRRLASLTLLLLQAAFAADNPKVIRFVTSTGVGGRPITGGSIFSYLDNKGILRDEFRKDGIKVEVSYLLGAGPAFNEAFANKLTDFATIGDLPSTVGKAGGLDTRIVIPTSRISPGAIVVPTDSRIQSVADLRGKRVAIFKGTATQLTANRILAHFNLSERDLKVVSMNSVASQAALASKTIDALFTGTAEAIRLVDQGLARQVYSTFDDPGAKDIGSDGVLLVSAEFERRYPHIVQRIVNRYIEAARKFATGSRDEIYKEWAKSGAPYSSYKRDFDRKDFKKLFNPAFDEEFAHRYKDAVTDIRRFGFTRKDVDIDVWFEPKYVNQALKEQKLENFWK